MELEGGTLCDALSVNDKDSIRGPHNHYTQSRRTTPLGFLALFSPQLGLFSRLSSVFSQEPPSAPLRYATLWGLICRPCYTPLSLVLTA